jgi:hypothetical protein
VGADEGVEGERGLVRALTSAGQALAVKGGRSESEEEKEKVVMERAQAIELLTHPTIAASQSQSDVLEGLFDASDRVEGGSVIVWWNDLEKDSRYKRWSPSLYAVGFFSISLACPILHPKSILTKYLSLL